MKLFISLVLLLAALAGCKQSTTSPDSGGLAGIYGADWKGDGKLVPFLKVETDGDGFILYEYHNGEWHRPRKTMTADAIISKTPEPVRRLTKADLEKEVNHPVDVEPDGLMAGALALVHVPSGWSDGGRQHPFITKSGYFALTMLGPVDLQRM